MVDGAASVGRCAVFADMLNAPIAELTMSHDIDACKYFLDTRALNTSSVVHLNSSDMKTYLVLLEAILENVLHDKTARFAQSNFMPHASQRIIDIFHDLGRRLSPSKLKEFLPDVTSVSVDDSFWDSTEQLMDHNGLVIFRYGVKCFLNNMTAKRIHGQVKGVASNRFCNLDNLLRCTMLKAALNKKVAKSIDHQRIGLSNNGLDNIVLLLSCANFKLLLQEN